MEVVNKAQFDEIVKDGVVLVDFFADWCGPCKMLAPVLEQLAEQNAGKIRVIKVNVDDEMELARKFNVVSIPNMVLFKNGEVVNTAMGFMPLPMLQQFVDSAL